MGKVTWGLIAANTIVFLLMFSMPEAMLEEVMKMFAIAGPVWYEIWRWFTHMFIHASASHLFVNMLGLYFFGKAIEEESVKWYLAVYFISGLLGGLVFIGTSPAFAVGASAAVFGVIGFAMLFDPVRRIHLYLFPIPLGIIALAFVIFESFVVAFQPQEFAGVANNAHLAGLIAGAILMFSYDFRRGMKGILILIVSAIVLILLSPFFTIIAAIGGIFIAGLDWVIGLVLYNLANLLGFLWV